MATLADIVKGVQETNNLLMSNVEAQKRVNQMMIDRDRDADASKMDALGASKKTPSKSGGFRGSMPKGFGAGFKKGIGGGLIGGIISSLFAAGSGLLGVITGALGLALGTLVLPIAAIGLIAKFGEDLIMGLLKEFKWTDTLLGPGDKSQFAADVTKAMIIGIGLAIFSPLLGLSAFIAGLLVAGIKQRFMNPQQAAAFEKDILDGAGKSWGITFSKENMMQLGIALGLLFTFSRLKSAFLGVLGLGARGGPRGASKGLMKSFAKGIMRRGPVGLILSAVSDIVGDKVGELTDNPEFGDLVGDTFNAAAIGFAIAGPYGALTLGLISLVAAGLNWATKHYAEKEEQLDKELTEKADKAEREAKTLADRLSAAKFRTDSNKHKNKMRNTMFSENAALYQAQMDAAAALAFGNENALTNREKTMMGFNPQDGPGQEGNVVTMGVNAARMAVTNPSGTQLDLNLKKYGEAFAIDMHADLATMQGRTKNTGPGLIGTVSTAVVDGLTSFFTAVGTSMVGTGSSGSNLVNSGNTQSYSSQTFVSGGTGIITKDTYEWAGR